ncbi:MAG: hypothetical protein LBT27_05520 [Prevotellaceae bacterium]|jgi:hypothetical protein|nr:hypothetical protein [Prevotellaceae bacterium]
MKRNFKILLGLMLLLIAMTVQAYECRSDVKYSHEYFICADETNVAIVTMGLALSDGYDVYLMYDSGILPEIITVDMQHNYVLIRDYERISKSMYSCDYINRARDSLTNKSCRILIF